MDRSSAAASNATIRFLWTVCLLLASACAPALRSPAGVTAPGQSADLDRLAAWMTGSFSSQDQARQNPEEYYDIRLEMVRIWPERKDGYWLYVEQAVAQALQKPYRQRVYHLREIAPDLLQSEVYRFEEPQRFIGAWQTQEPFTELQPEDLILRPGCSILLRPKGTQRFTGNTVGQECSSDLNGAAYAVSRVTLTEDLLVAWDQGFDEQGNQVWGPIPGGYEFVKTRDWPL